LCIQASVFCTRLTEKLTCRPALQLGLLFKTLRNNETNLEFSAQ
jgi:hypothetical protein